MNAITQFIQSLAPDGFNSSQFLKFVCFFALGILVLSVISRIFLGKKSTLTRSVSCSVTILCVYVVSILLYSTGAKLNAFLAPLPYVGVQGDYLVIYDLMHSDFSALCIHVLDMLILAFLVGLLDNWLPEGKNLFSKIGFRILSVILAVCLHHIASLLLKTILPSSFFSYSSMSLVIILLVSLVLSALKTLLGGAFAFLTPFLAIITGLLFHNLIGKQLIKAILITVILTGVVYLMNLLGITAVFIGSAVLIAYLPLLLLVLALWYVTTILL